MGTGKSRSFNDVAKNVISVLKKGRIEYIEFPDGLKEQYQSYTQADMSNLINSGYDNDFLSLEEGIERYVKWLESHK